MKLFLVNYLEDNYDGHYLTVGTDQDTEEDIEKREYDKKDWGFLYFFGVTEIKEVNGHKIILE